MSNVIPFPEKDHWWESFEVDEETKTKTFCAVLADINARDKMQDYNDTDEYYSMGMLLYLFQLIMRDNEKDAGRWVKP